MGLYRTIEESDERINGEDNIAKPDAVHIKKLHDGKRGPKPGTHRLSPSMRNLIGAAAEISNNNATVAKEFGVSERQVANYRKGRASHDAPIVPAAKEEITEIVETQKEKTLSSVKDKAVSSLHSLFDDPISPENLSTLKPREAISAAKDLATIVDKVTPKEVVQDNRIQLVVFSPRQREESEYNVVEIEGRELE
jgi:hypothetical protein